MANFKIQQWRKRAEQWLRERARSRGDLGALGAMRPRSYATLRKPLEYLLWIIAIMALGYCTAQYSAASIHQSRQSARLETMRAKALSAAESSSGVVAAATEDRHTEPAPLGRIEIPQVGVSAIVEEGESNSTLAESVGHISGTAMPGERGNSALAAHRDTYFRDLEDIQKGDSVYFTSSTAVLRYVVDDVSVVDPSDVSVIAPSNDSRLTLITCYPFHYVGPAPKRFIVTARLAENPER